MGNLGQKQSKKSRYLLFDVCCYCGNQGGTRDHIVPRHLHPTLKDSWSNLTGCCPECNQEKSVLPLLTFLWLRTLPKQVMKRERRRIIEEAILSQRSTEEPATRPT